jgi:hypothetical protein
MCRLFFQVDCSSQKTDRQWNAGEHERKSAETRKGTAEEQEGDGYRDQTSETLRFREDS